MRANSVRRLFNYKLEEGQNPYIGFMSFQHFRGEKMYSDIVITKEANMTETERVECYPISADAEENGRSEGYYPDTSIAYIRVLWKEFEPVRDRYNYGFIENIINEAKSHGQTLVFRLMAHSTRACDDVPEWLKELIPCPERPDGMRVKDSPTDPLFLELFLKAVKAFGERFDKEPTLDAIDISLPGAWGEGCNLHLYPDNVLETIVDTYTSVFKHTKLMTQLARPNLIRYAKRTAGANVGWRGDGLGDPHHMTTVYPPKIDDIPENWKSAPVSFESYWWIGEWMRQGWSIDEIIDSTLKWHISSFNGKSMPVPYKWRDKVDYWCSRMGYHFTINSSVYPETISADDTLDLTVEIENVGVAPLYNKMSLKLRLKNEENEYIFDTSVNPQSWLPGKHTESISASLPCDVKKGNYDIEIGLISDVFPVIYFATDAVRDGAYYKLGAVNIV